MSAFVTALVGDVWNVSVVAVVVLTAAALAFTGHAGFTAFVIPLLTLAGVALLARR